MEEEKKKIEDEEEEIIVAVGDSEDVYDEKEEDVK